MAFAMPPPDMTVGCAHSSQIAPVLIDPAYYQTFFSKVDKGIFIQKEKL